MSLFLFYEIIVCLITIVLVTPKSFSKFETKKIMNYFLLVSFGIKTNFSFTCKTNK